MSQQEHSFANPAPAGLGALAIACFAFFALLTGRVSHEAAPILATWLVGGAICQVAAGLIELKDHNIAGGNLMLFFGSFFMVTGALGMLIKTDLAAKGIAFDAGIEGYTWLCAFLVLVCLTPCYLKANKVFFWLVIVADVAVLFLALGDLGIAKATLAPAAGWLLLLAGFLALYLVAAIAINTSFGKTVLPLPAPYVK
jgi:succinate-acetate transporter protein